MLLAKGRLPTLRTSVSLPRLFSRSNSQTLSNGSGQAHRSRTRDAKDGGRAVCLGATILERPVNKPSYSGGRSKPAELPAPTVAYELVQGPLVRWSENHRTRAPPTVVLVHGILGSRKNMLSFAHRLVEGFPSWQVLLVDLRCHGESAALPHKPAGPHTVHSAAEDVLRLLQQLKLFPEMLIGHSFGGKVVMSMAELFGRVSRHVPRPVKVWVLDALPGEVRAGDTGRKDHPADLITKLRSLPVPISNRHEVVDYLLQQGFSLPIARWTITNLRPAQGSYQLHDWVFDLDGIAQMYQSYETTQLWSFLREPPKGVTVEFVKAERSTFRWGGPDEETIRSYGHGVHLLRDSGHWVHSDNPDGLFDILAPSFGTTPDIHMQRADHLAQRGYAAY